jgi:hypothetical protein
VTVGVAAVAVLSLEFEAALAFPAGSVLSP